MSMIQQLEEEILLLEHTAARLRAMVAKERARECQNCAVAEKAAGLPVCPLCAFLMGLGPCPSNPYRMVSAESSPPHAALEPRDSDEIPY